jgi:hypothetical protein
MCFTAAVNTDAVAPIDLLGEFLKIAQNISMTTELVKD